MKLNPQDLKKIALLTLEHYNLLAEEFWKGTRYHNVSQNIEALLQHIKGNPPFTILDFGCGPGRDLKAFVEQGHNAIGLEGAEHLDDRLASGLNGDLLLERVGFHGPDAVQAPVGGTHFFDDAEFDAVGRLETALVILHEDFEVGGVFAGEKQALG